MAPYVKPERILLKAHREYNERWVQERIKEDPKILGLGNLVLLQEERIQPSGGRLDLLLQDADTKRRYEVELQLGATDEAHIIRAIEYWDVERKRYPQYDHCAVLIAEDVTSRFLNVISLFNGSIPLVAIQMQAFNVGESTTLIFTTVIDELSRGLVEDDEAAPPTDRAYWETKFGKAKIALADDLLKIAHEFDPTLRLKYNKFYIGLTKDDRAFNFVTFVPQKYAFLFEPRIPQSNELDKRFGDEGLDTSYDKLWHRYSVRLGQDDVKKHEKFLREMMRLAYELQKG
ncbi:MAG TPA: hypothetical protein VMV59_03505 [Candidatus Dormibacteraeota bacterium]|nr:hypothetical protein [Candidatus Dormibacteraeota bacterium]